MHAEVREDVEKLFPPTEQDIVPRTSLYAHPVPAARFPSKHRTAVKSGNRSTRTSCHRCRDAVAKRLLIPGKSSVTYARRSRRRSGHLSVYGITWEVEFELQWNWERNILRMKVPGRFSIFSCAVKKGFKNPSLLRREEDVLRERRLYKHEHYLFCINICVEIDG